MFVSRGMCTRIQVLCGYCGFLILLCQKNLHFIFSFWIQETDFNNWGKCETMNSPLEFLPKDNGTCFHGGGGWFMMKNIKSSGFWPLCESICAPVYHLHKRLSVPPTTHICWRVLAGLTLTGITSINLACINNPPGISSHVLL